MGAIVVLTPDQLEELIERAVKSALLQSRPDTMPGESQTLLTKQEAAQLIKVSTSTIDYARRDGRLTAHYVGKFPRFDRGEVLALAKNTH